MTMRILALGTYPIIRPVHGGQRRVAAFKRFYEHHGATYTHVCIYNAEHYGRGDVGRDDWPLIVPPAKAGLVNLIGDVIAGRQFETDEPTLRHFADLIERTKPDALQLEHPFMWPLAKRLRQMVGGLQLIYSSHNVEGPLKEEILASSSVVRELRRAICAEIEEIEAELCREADLIVCVSSSDRNHYCRSRAPADVIIVPNGVDRPPQTSRYWANETAQREFAGRPFVMTVSSAHPPNIDGLCHYLFSGGMFCVPPLKSIAICGGVSEPVFHHAEYQRYVAANSARVQFFPKIDDDELWALKQSCHGAFLPLRSGGGSNLKTAEALALGKWIVATPISLRGFEGFCNAEGVIVANDATSFRRGLHDILQRPPLEISAASRTAREALYWDRCFADSGLAKAPSLQIS